MSLAWAVPIASAIIGGAMSKSSAKSQAQLQAELARQNWEYQQKNAHQFEVEDLKAAGLNPILSATNSQMAGMSSVTASDPSNMANNLTSAVQGVLERQLKKDMKAQDIDIENKKLKNDSLRIQNERDELEAQLEKWKAEGKLLSAQTSFTQGQTAKVAAETSKVFEDIANNNLIAHATVRQLESGTALNYQQIQGVKAQMLKAVADSKLSDQQREALNKEIESGTRALENKSASMQADFLDTWYGSIAHQFGYGLSLINPFSGIASKIGSVSVGSRK